MIELKLKQNPETLLEVFSITPSATRGMSTDQICRQTVFLGNERVELGDWFSVSGDASDLHHVWRGDLSRVSGIGHQMSAGWIQIEGDAGHHVGSRMSGGTIHVDGSTGNFIGAEMTGGLIHIKGDAGSSVGAAYDGGQQGQNGGAILITGSAGNLIGKSMRRGLIAIGGNVKNCCGFSMKAGTIIVYGQARKNVGLEMTRGTIILANPPDQPSQGFVDGGVHAMPVTRMIDRYVNQLGFSRSMNYDSWRVFHGDPLHGGRGELLIAS